MADDLTPQQIAMLEFERLRWTYQAAKETAISEQFEMSPTTYYSSLHAVLDLPAAEAFDALLVRRLRRLRDRRRAARAASRLDATERP